MKSVKRRRHNKFTVTDETVPTISLNNLPPEMLEKIIKLFSYQEIQQTLRLVCKRLYEQCRDIMQRTFMKIHKELETSLLNVEEKISDGTMSKRTCVVLYLLESLQFLYRLLHAVTWRYTLKKDSPHFFYGGRILDMFNYFLYKTQQIYQLSESQVIIHVFSDSQVIKELVNFHKSCKIFCSHFEKVIEYEINNHYAVSGSKLIDILNCLEDPHSMNKRIYLLETDNFDIHQSRYIAEYRFPRAWFVAIPTPRPLIKYRNWAEKQRYMYMRIRRLVFNYSKQAIETRFIEKLSIIRHVLPSPTRTFGTHMYSGYGLSSRRFFYYGCMTKEWYDRKFNRIPIDQQQNINNGFIDNEEENDADISDNEDELEERVNPPQLFLTITTYLTAPLKLSPYDILSHHTTFQSISNDPPLKLNECNFFLRMDFECASSKENNLPGIFYWTISSDNQSFKQKRKNI